MSREKLAEIQDSLRDLDYDAARDLRDWLLDLLGRKQKSRRGRPPIAMALQHNRKLDEIASKCLELTDDEKEIALGTLPALILALSPITYRRDGAGHVQVKYIRRPRWDEDLGRVVWRRFGPYAYLRIWSTGGNHDKERKILRNVYLGRIFGSGLEAEVVSSAEIVKAWHAGEKALSLLEDEVKKRLR